MFVWGGGLVEESVISKDKDQCQAMHTSPYAQQNYRQIVNNEKEVTSMFMDVVLSVEDLIQQKFTSIEIITEEAMYFKVGFKAQYGKKKCWVALEGQTMVLWFMWNTIRSRLKLLVWLP